MIIMHTLEIPQSISSFAKGISGSRSGFASGRLHSLLAFSGRVLYCGRFIYSLVLSLFIDVRDLQSILMWVVVLQQKGLFIKNQRYLSQGFKYGTAWKVDVNACCV